MNFSALLTLIRKEFLSVLRDPKIRLSILMPPVIQLLIFTFAATLDVKDVTMGVVNQDHGEQGFLLLERFYGAPVFRHITYLESEAQIPAFIDEQKGVMVLSIGVNFSRELDQGKPAHLQMILDGRRSNTAQIVSGYTAGVVGQFMETHHSPKAEIIPRNWFNPNLLYYWYNIPCLVAILAMLTCLVVTTQTVAREREMGTFDQLLVSPLSKREIIIGKMVPGIVVGILEGLFMMVVGIFAFQVPFTGSFFLYLCSLLVFVISMSGIGLFISSLCSTQQQAMLGTFIFMTPAVLLSGFGTPVENMPHWLQPVSYCIPLNYMLVISKGVFLKAMSARIVWQNVYPMCIIACVTVAGAGIFFRRRLE